MILDEFLWFLLFTLIQLLGLFISVVCTGIALELAAKNQSLYVSGGLSAIFCTCVSVIIMTLQVYAISLNILNYFYQTCNTILCGGILTFSIFACVIVIEHFIYCLKVKIIGK